MRYASFKFLFAAAGGILSAFCAQTAIWFICKSLAAFAVQNILLSILQFGLNSVVRIANIFFTITCIYIY